MFLQLETDRELHNKYHQNDKSESQKYIILFDTIISIGIQIICNDTLIKKESISFWLQYIGVNQTKSRFGIYKASAHYYTYVVS